MSYFVVRLAVFAISLGMTSPTTAVAEQLRGVELTRSSFEELSLVERMYLQITLKGYGLYEGPVDGEFDYGVLHGLSMIGILLGRQRYGDGGGYEIDHPQPLSALLGELFSGRVFDLFPFPNESLLEQHG